MFKTAWFCVDCEEELTYGERMYSHGRCPKCGFKHKNAGTIVTTFEKAYKEVKVPSGKWWKPDSYGRKFIEVSCCDH